jgi:hypothetical protein
MEAHNPHDPAPDTPFEDKRSGDEPDPSQKQLKDNEKSELGGAKN